MTLHSFFLPGFTSTQGLSTSLSAKEYPEWFHQISSVLRARQGSELCILDNKGSKYYMQIQNIDKKSVTLLCMGIEKGKQENNLTLWIPYIKLPRLEIALQMCTQLGVTHFKIFQSEFTDEKIELLSTTKKERLLRIITEASEQSERFFIPTIEYISTDLRQIPFDTNVFVAIERGQYETSDQIEKAPRTIMVGPEGGWSPAEIDFFKKDPRFYPLDLHCTTILRAETAAVVALSVILSDR